MKERIDREYLIKIREDGCGYKKGDRTKAIFHGCQTVELEEQAILTFVDGAAKGKQMTVPFRCFRFEGGYQ
jgi:hypothetical protein